MNLLKTGASWLAEQLQENASEAVIYRRGSDSVPVQATLGSQLLRSTDRQGFTKMERTERDFIIRAADLILSGQLVKPQRGDIVDILDPDGSTDRFEVVPYGQDAPYRFSDPHQLMFRIHAKFRQNFPVFGALTDETVQIYLTAEDGVTFLTQES